MSLHTQPYNFVGGRDFPFRRQSNRDECNAIEPPGGGISTADTRATGAMSESGMSDDGLKGTSYKLVAMISGVRATGYKIVVHTVPTAKFRVFRIVLAKIHGARNWLYCHITCSI